MRLKAAVQSQGKPPSQDFEGAAVSFPVLDHHDQRAIAGFATALPEVFLENC